MRGFPPDRNGERLRRREQAHHQLIELLDVYSEHHMDRLSARVGAGAREPAEHRKETAVKLVSTLN